MRLPVVLAAFLAVCGSSAIPTAPGDNSHYVEGKSRYIWMPDGHGVPQLVDLEEPVDNPNERNGANNQYWLYTRRNPNSTQILVHGNATSVFNSNYCNNCQTKVIVHGWKSNGHSEINPMITAAFLAVGDVNVIVVDWAALASASYRSAVAGVPGVGQFLGDILVWLISLTDGNWNNLHLVGFSLGAHVVGNAGRQAGGRPVRVTGLDPAGPLWSSSSNSSALNRSAGVYVECIHTDGRRLGIFDPIGHADFYPNRGRNPQPGCWFSPCSHMRAYELFASSVYTANRFVGRKCGNIEQASNNQCSGCSLNMGNAQLTKRGAGLFGLTTGNSWPFSARSG